MVNAAQAHRRRRPGLDIRYDLGEGETFVHEGDRDAVPGRAGGVMTFSERHLLGEDFEVIPTPGHTPGHTVYLWSGVRHRILFTGDTLYLSEGKWAAAVLESSDRERYVASLELLRELDFDLPHARHFGDRLRGDPVLSPIPPICH